MKYTIEGFNQAAAVELGLNAESLVILRWFIDFWGSGKMHLERFCGDWYGLVTYQKVQDDLPILRGKKRTIAAKFQKLCDVGVLKHATLRNGGTFPYYSPCFEGNFWKLIPPSQDSDD